MRLTVMAEGLSFRQRLILGIIRTFTGFAPGPVLVWSYRKEWFGRAFSEALETAMRRPEHWHPREAELLATWTAQSVHCSF